MSNYCLPIQKSAKNEVLRTIGDQSSYDFFEVWVDMIEDFDMSFLDTLLAKLGDKLVVVFRRPNVAPMHMPLATRLEVLEHLHDTPALVDLDINSQVAELEYRAKHHLRLQTIVSHHNYQRTPTDSELHSIVKVMLAHQPTILKLATKCEHEQDALRLMQLLLTLRDRQQRFIVLGMGGAGVMTRIFGTLWGNELTFAPRSLATASAPGQFTQADMNTVLTLLKG